VKATDLSLTTTLHSKKSPRPRVLIADDHSLLAERCKRVLESEFDVLGIVKDGRELVAVAISQKPDLVVLDISMPFLNGLDAGALIKQNLPAVKLLFLTVNHDVYMADEAFRRGATGYLLKSCPSSELMEAVRSILLGGSHLSNALRKE
jgi:DNA-binding NarL/FixJ family response regulator